MRKMMLIATFLGFLYCSDKKETTVTTDTTSESISQKDREIDSLKAVIADKENQEQTDASEDANQTPEESPADSESNDLRDLSGKHALTLQWISWADPGTVLFTRTGPAQYKIVGSQKIGKDYVNIDGIIRQTSNEELDFEGTIETFVENIGGKCLRTGPQLFLVTKNRKYWRLQNMTECFGLTDYIDIYF